MSQTKCPTSRSRLRLISVSVLCVFVSSWSRLKCLFYTDYRQNSYKRAQKLHRLFCAYCILARARKTANEDIKNICRELRGTIVTSVTPDSITDHLFSKRVISTDDYIRLRHVPVSIDRCRDFLSGLYVSSHHQAFIYLRLALLNEYPWIANEIDKQMPSLISQLQQLEVSRSSDGKLSL